MILISLAGSLLSSIFFLNISLNIADFRLPDEAVLPYVKKEQVDRVVRWVSRQAAGTATAVLSGSHRPSGPSGKGLPLAALRQPLRLEATSSDPAINASSSLVMDGASEAVLFADNAEAQVPIASITKLVTAMVFLDHNPGWSQTYVMRDSDRREGGKIYLFTGDKVTARDLFYLSLVASGNSETVALASATGLAPKEFVAKMNEKMRDLGLSKTVFHDVVGLDERNVSTAREVALLAKTALGQKEIMDATLTSRYRFTTLGGRPVAADSTDWLLGGDLAEGVTLLGGKTGYLTRAGYCFVGKFSEPEQHAVISVILGAPSEAARFTEARKLVNWAYANYRWQ